MIEVAVLAALSLLVLKVRKHTIEENKRVCDSYQCRTEAITQALEKSNVGANNP